MIYKNHFIFFFILGEKMFLEQLFKETEQKDRNLLDDCDHQITKKYNMGDKKIKFYCTQCNILVSEKMI